MKIKPVAAGHRSRHVDFWEAFIALLGIVGLAAVAFMAGASYERQPQVENCAHPTEQWPA